LLRDQPLACSRNHSGVHIMDLRHIVELHKAVGGKNLIGGSVAEPREAYAWNFKPSLQGTLSHCIGDAQL
jgi:hypothetical protein